MQPNALGGYRYPSGKLTRCRHAGGIGGRESRDERRGLRGEGETRGIVTPRPIPRPSSLASRLHPGRGEVRPGPPNEDLSGQMAKCHVWPCDRFLP